MSPPTMPQTVETEVFARLPDQFSPSPVGTPWAAVRRLDLPDPSFLEGPPSIV